MLDSLTRTELQDVLLEVWRRDWITAIMVTHDVDEALFLSDRVVMMTSGPQAKVGDVLPSLTRTELQDVLLEVWRRDWITAIMVTHDVDEALFLSDRVVMMTSGPQAKVGDVLPVEFPRPRD